MCPSDLLWSLGGLVVKSCRKTLIFTTLDTSQLKKIDNYESIYSVNPLYLRINHASGYIEQKKWK